MIATKKIAGLLALMILLALAAWLIGVLVAAKRSADFLGNFEKIHTTKPALSVAQVEQLMGRPLRIEHSDTADQNLSGDVYHYPTYPVGGDFQVIFVHGVVFGTAIPSYTKS